MNCPYCKQGLTVKAKIKADGAIVYICDECDVVWKGSEPISDQTGRRFDAFAQESLIKPLWDALEILQ